MLSTVIPLSYAMRQIILALGAALSLLLITPLCRAGHTPSPKELRLASVYATVVDLKSGETLYRKHAELPTPIASVTKLMTATVVLEGGQPLDEWLTIVGWDHQPKKNAYSRLRIGSQAQRRELLRIALMSSENLATNVLAHYYPGGTTAFVAAMNAKAKSLGMTASHFVDPAGLSPRISPPPTILPGWSAPPTTSTRYTTSPRAISTWPTSAIPTTPSPTATRILWWRAAAGTSS